MAGRLVAADENRGVIFYERFLGSSNTLGNVLGLDTTLGYSFNRYFSIDGGLPVHFIRPSDTTTATVDTRSTNGIVNVPPVVPLQQVISTIASGRLLRRAASD